MKSLCFFTLITLFSTSTITPGWWGTSKPAETKSETVVYTLPMIEDELENLANSIPAFNQELKTAQAQNNDYFNFIEAQGEQLLSFEQEAKSVEKIAIHELKAQKTNCRKEHQAKVANLDHADDNFTTLNTQLANQHEADLKAIDAHEKNITKLRNKIHSDLENLHKTLEEKLNSEMINAQADVIELLQNRRENWLASFADNYSGELLPLGETIHEYSTDTKGEYISMYEADITNDYARLQYTRRNKGFTTASPQTQQIIAMTTLAVDKKEQTQQIVGKATCIANFNGDIRCKIAIKDFEEILNNRAHNKTQQQNENKSTNQA